MGLSFRLIGVAVILLEYIIFNTRFHKISLIERIKLYLRETPLTCV